MDKNISNNKKYVSTSNIYKYFEEYGYSEDEVDVVISNLNEKQMKSLHNYYGEDLHNPVINENIDEDEKKYVTRSVIVCMRKKLKSMNLKDISKISTFQKKVSTANIYNYFEEYGYSEDEVDVVISSLNEKQMKSLHNYYGEDLHDPVINENIDEDEKKYVTKAVIVCIRRKLNSMNSKDSNKISTFQKKVSMDNIYNYFKEYGYSEDEVDKAIAMLTDKQRNALYSYYGEDLHNPVINENLDEDKKRYATKSVIVYIKRRLNSMNSKDNSKTSTFKKHVTKENIYEYFKEYGYSEDKVDKAIAMLTKKQRESLHDYYGEDLHNPKINNDLSETQKNYVKSIIIGIIRKKLKYVDGKKTSNIRRVCRENIYDYFNEYGYSEEEVDKAISMLTDEQRKMLCSYYGEDLHNPVINKCISNNKKANLFRVIETKLKQRKSKKLILSKQDLYKYYNEYGYSEEQVDSVIPILNKKQRESLYEYYGNDLHNPKINDNISKDKKDYVLKSVTVTIKDNLDKMYSNDNNNMVKPIGIHVKYDNIYNYFKEYGYNEDEVDKAISVLIEKQRKALYSYYGGNLHNPKIDENVSTKEKNYIMMVVIRTIKNKLKKMSDESLSNPTKKRVSKKDIYKYFEEYGYSENKVDKAISMLTDGQRQALYRYYGGDLHNPKIDKNMSSKDKSYVEYSIFNCIKLRLNILCSLDGDKQDNVVSNDVIDNTEIISDEETFVEKIKLDEKEDVQISINCTNLADQLCKNNIFQVLSFIDKYLELNQKGDYFDLLVDLMKISIIDGDNNYINVVTLLENINSIDLYDLLAANIQSFYVVLVDNKLELTELYLDVIITLDKLGACCVLKDNFEKIYRLSRDIYKLNVKSGKLSEFDKALSRYKNIKVVNQSRESSDAIQKVKII